MVPKKSSPEKARTECSCIYSNITLPWRMLNCDHGWTCTYSTTKRKFFTEHKSISWKIYVFEGQEQKHLVYTELPTQKGTERGELDLWRKLVLRDSLGLWEWELEAIQSWWKVGEDATGVDQKGTEEEPDLRYSWSNVKIEELQRERKRNGGSMWKSTGHQHGTYPCKEVRIRLTGCTLCLIQTHISYK